MLYKFTYFNKSNKIILSKRFKVLLTNAEVKKNFPYSVSKYDSVIYCKKTENFSFFQFFKINY